MKAFDIRRIPPALAERAGLILLLTEKLPERLMVLG
jgi:hypothetical protein